MGLPLSRLSMTASSCWLRRISLASSIIAFLRLVGCSRDQVPASKVSLALPTARSTSAFAQAAIRLSSLPVAGLIVSKVAPLREGQARPAITAPDGSAMADASDSYSSRVKSNDIACSPTPALVENVPDGGLYRPDRDLELPLLVDIETAHRLAHRTRRQSGQLAAILDALDELAALLEHAHEWQQRGHDAPALDEIVLDRTSPV